MYIDAPERPGPIPVSPLLALAILICSLGVVIMGIYPKPFVLERTSRRRHAILGGMAKSARLTACALALLVAVTTPPPRSPRAGDSRLADPKQVAAGTFFAEHAALLASNPSWEAEEMRVMGGTEPRAALADAAGRLDDDSLAREIIRALDAVRSAELTIRVLRGLFPDEPTFLAQVDAAQHMVNMPDGSTRRLPLVQVWRLQRGLARLAVRYAGGATAGPLAGRDLCREAPRGRIARSSPAPSSWYSRAARWSWCGRVASSTPSCSGRASWPPSPPSSATPPSRAGGRRRGQRARPGLEVYLSPLGSPDLVLAGSKFQTCTFTLTGKR